MDKVLIILISLFVFLCTLALNSHERRIEAIERKLSDMAKSSEPRR